MDPLTTRSQPDPGAVNRNPIQQGNLPPAQNVRAQQSSSNINKPNVVSQPTTNYQSPQQQPTQNYRLPSAGQQQQQSAPPSNFPNQQPSIRPPLIPNPRPLINQQQQQQQQYQQQQQQQQQQQNIRHLPPQQNPTRPPINQQNQQFRPPPPQFHQQQQQQQQQGQQQRQGYQPHLEQQQFRPAGPRPVNPQEQKVLQRPPPPPQQSQQQSQQQQQQHHNMTSEISREKTFTAMANNNNNSSNEPHSMAMEDDDDDVVVGRMMTPQSRNGQKPAEAFDQPRPMSGKESAQPVPISRPPMQQTAQPVAPPPPPAAQPDMRRRESVQSIPSRPPSGLGSHQSISPEQRMSPNPPPVHQMAPRPPSAHGNSNDHANDYDRGQRPMSHAPPPHTAAQRQSPEDMHRPKIQPQPHQPSPPPQPPSVHHQPPPPSAYPQQQQPQQHQQQRHQQQNEHERPPQQPSIQAHLPFVKPAMMNMAPMQAENTNGSASAASERKKAVELDLSKTSNVRGSLKDRSPKGDNDSGVDESTQEKEKNGNSPNSPLKSPTKIPSYQTRPASITPKTRSRSTSKQRLSLRVSPEEPEAPIKRVPMNKIEAGNAPSPNLKKVQSKIGSLQNASHKPGGGHVKIETKKLEFKAAPRIEAKNESYVPRGGEKKIVSQKLQWNAKSKIGSLENANHKPGGGDKKIIEIKTDFKEKAKPKVGSKDNLGYVPGGGDVKIINEKLDVKAESKIGSLDNVGHKPGGGERKIFDDKEYLKNVEHPVPITPPSQMFSSGYFKSKTLNWRSKPYTLTTSLSLPSECIIMSVCSPAKKKRIIAYSGKAFHPTPFRCF